MARGLRHLPHVAALFRKRHAAKDANAVRAVRFPREAHRTVHDLAAEFPDASGGIDPGLAPLAEDRIVEGEARAVVPVLLRIRLADHAARSRALDPAHRDGLVGAADLP